MRTHHITVSLGILFVLVHGLSRTQEPQRMLIRVPSSPQVRTPLKDGKTVIPFEIISNHMVIPVEINGKTLKLILDTGMPFEGALLFGGETADVLGLPYAGKASVMGAGGGGRVDADRAMGISLKLPGVELSDQMVLVMPPDSVQSRYFEGRDGIIGQSLFGRFVVGIDHDKMEITLFQPDQFAYTGSGKDLPIRMDRYPFLVCEAQITGGKKIPMELVIDTGNNASVMLNVGAQDGIVLPEKVITYHTKSLGNEMPFLMGRIERLCLGPYALNHLLGSFRTSAHEPAPPWEKVGALGEGVLRRFNVVFDCIHKKLFFEPNSHFSDPFEFNMAGIQLTRAAQGRFLVSRVIPGSPAYTAGLQKGDFIVRMNGRPADQFSVNDRDTFFMEEGKKVTLDIQRGNEPLKMEFKLQRVI